MKTKVIDPLGEIQEKNHFNWIMAKHKDNEKRRVLNEMKRARKEEYIKWSNFFNS